jgi:hypothetical protein
MTLSWVDGTLDGGTVVIDYRVNFRVSLSGDDYVTVAENIVA